MIAALFVDAKGCYSGGGSGASSMVEGVARVRPSHSTRRRLDANVLRWMGLRGRATALWSPCPKEDLAVRLRCWPPAIDAVGPRTSARRDVLVPFQQVQALGEHAAPSDTGRFGNADGVSRPPSLDRAKCSP